MSVSQTPDYTNAPPLNLAAVRQAREFITADDGWTPDQPVDYPGDPVEVMRNLLAAYDALAARHAVLAAFGPGVNTSRVGDPCPACGREIDPDGN